LHKIKENNNDFSSQLPEVLSNKIILVQRNSQSCLEINNIIPNHSKAKLAVKQLQLTQINMSKIY